VTLDRRACVSIRAMRRTVCLLALVACALLPAGAQAKSSPYLWATINACDHPAGAVGIRGSMPGNGTGQRMYMRFSAQFRNAAGHFVETGSSTRWVKVGSARRMSIQSGVNFTFTPPDPGGGYVFRGKVDFRWTARTGKKWKVVRNESRITRSGVKGVEHATPAGKSEGLCLIRR
jgi:hypothetical protein